MALAKPGKRNDPGAKLGVLDTSRRGRLGQQTGLGYSGNRVDLQNERLSILGQNRVHPRVDLQTSRPKSTEC